MITRMARIERISSTAFNRNNSGLGSNKKMRLHQQVITTHKYENLIGILEIRLARIKEVLGGASAEER